jgi:integrase
MLSYAKRMGYIANNPARGIPKPADNPRPFHLSSEGYRELGQALQIAEREGEHWQATAAIRLIALTGCRRSEILNLKWREVDFKRSCLRLGDSKTGVSERPLPVAAQDILATCKRECDYVLPSITRRDRSYASAFPKAWRRVIGSAYTPHGLRHAYASAANELDLNDLRIGELLGHARLGVTNGYIAKMDNVLLAAAEKVSRYIVNAMSGCPQETDRTVAGPAARAAIVI